MINPSLIFVMAGAVAVHFVTYKLIRKRRSPLLSTHWHVPTKKEITPALTIGAFITSLASFDKTPFVFVISMLVGMFLFRQIDKKLNLQNTIPKFSGRFWQR